MNKTYFKIKFFRVAMNKYLFLCLIVLLSSLSACSSSSVPVKYYLLSAPEALSINETSNHRIGILPVRMPTYLQRTQMVLRESDKAEVRIDEFNRWAEDLPLAFQRVLSIALTNELASSGTSASPLRLGFPVDYKLTIDIRNFEGDLQKNVILDASWILQENSDILLEGNFKKTLSVGSTYQDLITIQGELIEELAKEIAVKLQEAQ